MAKTDDNAKRQLPPYVSYKTLTGFLRKLKETVIPEKIDADVLRSYPGSTARQLKAALRFLDLMNDDDRPTGTLSLLVDAMDTDEWPQTFQKILANAYAPIIGDLPIERTTRVQIEGRFRDYQATEKEVLDKIVGFYVSALINAGVKVSPLILDRSKPRPNGKQRQRRGARPDHDRAEGGNAIDTMLPPLGTVRFTVPIPDKSAATMLLPPDLTVDDWEMVSAMVKAYISRRNKSGA